MAVEDTLQLLFKDNFSHVREFSLKFLGNRDEAAIKGSFDTLRKLGISLEKIARYASLLKHSSKKIRESYANLFNLGISSENICRYPVLIGSNPYKYLIRLMK